MSEENISVLSSDSSTTLQVDNAALIEELENNDGDTVYPVTIDKAIYCSDGTRFDNKLQKYVHWSDDTSAEAPDVRIADNLGGQYTATDITNMSNSINTISNNLADMSKIKIERNIANCLGTTISTHTLSVPMKNYTDRNVVATCTGGSHTGCQIDSVIPKSANTIDVVWTANLPSSGTVNVTFMYEID